MYKRFLFKKGNVHSMFISSNVFSDIVPRKQLSVLRYFEMNH